MRLSVLCIRVGLAGVALAVILGGSTLLLRSSPSWVAYAALLALFVGLIGCAGCIVAALGEAVTDLRRMRERRYDNL